MKFSASFAVLAVFVAKSVVSAAPMPVYESDIEARTEFVVSLALSVIIDTVANTQCRKPRSRKSGSASMTSCSIKSRLGNMTRNFLNDPQWKGLRRTGPNLILSACMSTLNHLHKSILMATGQLHSARSHARAQNGGTGAKPPVHFREIPVAVKHRGPLSQIRPPGGRPSRRSLDDLEEDLFVRIPMKKFGTDLAINLAQKAPGYAQQYSQSQSQQRQQTQPRIASVYVCS